MSNAAPMTDVRLYNTLRDHRIPTHIVDTYETYRLTTEEFLEVQPQEWKQDFPQLPTFLCKRLSNIQTALRPQPIDYALALSQQIGSTQDLTARPPQPPHDAFQITHAPHRSRLQSSETAQQRMREAFAAFHAQPLGGISGATAIHAPHQSVELFSRADLSAPTRGVGGSSGGSGSGPLQFNRPWGVAAHPEQDLIFVNDHWNHRIQILRGDLTLRGLFGQRGRGPGALDHPRGVAVLPFWEQLAVVDNNNNRVQIFTTDGRVVSEAGSKGSQAAHFDEPFHVTADADGLLYVSDRDNNRIQVLHKDGHFVRQISGGLRRPMGVALTSEAHLAVVEEGGRAIKLFEREGRWLRDITIPKVDRYSYLAAGPLSSTITLSDFKANRICIYSLHDGSCVHSWGSAGSGLGEFDNPTGIAWAPNGHLYVADFDNHRVMRF
eukprot:TRINITY_DN8106_c0_g2_i1.p1 TRINITY_DN8106_c0_g2~~TRINITY_DN8106_c0_g2_i1.p1  ORF type:complete len:436 (+),score=65.25 TRINITY_DN8106_c0_g2_i1:69-1376(+)